MKKLLQKEIRDTYQPPISFIKELQDKMKERRQEISEQDPVQFQEFDKDRDSFVPLTEEDRQLKAQKHTEELKDIRLKEEQEKREMDRLVR